MRKWPFLVAAFVLLAGFAGVVGEAMRLGLPENDLWWMMPAMHVDTEGKSAAHILSFLLGPLPIGFAQPILKLYLFAVNAWLGPQVRWLILVSAGAHLGCAALLYPFCRRLGLGRREGGLAALLYLSLAAHFHAVLWPTASQHLFAVMTILLLLTLYLEVEARIALGSRSAALFAGALAVGLAGSLQRSTVIALPLIGAHLLFCSESAEERVRRYVRWAPLGFVYFLYPVWILTQVGDPVITEVLRKLPFPEAAKAFLVTDPLVPNPVLPWVRTVVVWLASAAGLALGAPALRLFGRIRVGRAAGGWLAALACAAAYLFWSRQDSRQLLLPYNLMTPLMATLASFFEPVRAVLSIRTTEAFHYLPAQVSPWSIALTLGAAGFFFRTMLPRNRALILLPAWALVTTVLTLHQSSSFPLQTPSRYFLYISPVACILLGALLVAGLGRRNLILCVLICVLGLSNLAAVRVALFRGRLANTYLAYDDLRTLRLVLEDLPPPVQDPRARGTVVVAGVVPMPIREQWADFPLPVTPEYDNLFFMARGAAGVGFIRGLHPAATGGLHPGQAHPKGIPPDYILLEGRLLRRNGEEVDPFQRKLQAGIQALDRGSSEEARALLVDAARTRPFLLRYLLGPLRLMDSRWLTDGLDLRDWLQRLDERFGPGGSARTEKAEQVRRTCSQDLSDFTLCLFLLSYADHLRGEEEWSRHWLSQIQYVDRDPGRVAAALGSYPRVQADPGMRRFLHETVEDPLAFLEPYFWKKEDYAFGRLLLRLLFQWDIRSSWDRRFSPML